MHFDAFIALATNVSEACYCKDAMIVVCVMLKLSFGMAVSQLQNVDAFHFSHCRSTHPPLGG